MINGIGTPPSWTSKHSNIRSYVERAFTSPVITYPPRNVVGNTSEALPSAALGGTIPKICGTVRSNFLNPLWWGWGGTYVVNNSTTVDENGVVTTINEVRNFINAHLGICTGPDVIINRIWYNDQLVIKTPKYDGEQFDVKVLDLLGASFTFHAGGYNQAVDPKFEEDDNDLTSSYPGVAYLYMRNAKIDGAFSDMSLELKRIPNPLGLAPEINVSPNGLDVNLITLLVDALTDPFNGPGYSISDFNVVELVKAAAILAEEGNFGSLVITDEAATTTSIIAEIENQADGVGYVDPRTGLISFVLLRFDPNTFDPVGAPVYGPENMQSRPKFQKEASVENVSKVQVNYTSRSLLYAQDMVTAQTFLSPSAGRASDAVTFYFPFCCDKNLATSLATRKLAQLALQQATFEVELDRSAAELEPGTVCLVNFPAYNIPNMLAHVVRRKEAGRVEAKVLVTFRQVVQATDIPIYPPAPEPPPQPDYTPVDITEAEFMDPPFFLHMARLQAYLSASYMGSGKLFEIIPDSGMTGLYDVTPKSWPMIFAKAENEWQYSVRVMAQPSFGAEIPFWPISNFIQYSYRCELVAPLSRYDGFNDGFVEQIDLVPNITPKAIDFADIVVDANPIREIQFLFIGSEIIQFETINILPDGTLRLNNCHRGMFDTVAEDHAANKKVWLPTRLGIGESYMRENSVRDMALVNDGFLPGSIGSWFSFFPGIQLPLVIYANVEFTVQELNTAKTFRLYPITKAPKGTPATVPVVAKEIVWNSPSVRRADLPNKPNDTRIAGVRSESPFPLTRFTDVTISWRINPRWNTMLTTPEFWNRGPITDRHRLVYLTELGSSFGMTFPLTWGLTRPRHIAKQKDPSIDNEMDTFGKYVVHRVMLKDADDVEFVLGETLDTDMALNFLTVTIPTDAALGAGVLWVESENYMGVSKFKDLLPVNIA